MKTCPYCGKEYPDDATVCAVDQTPLAAAGISTAPEKNAAGNEAAELRKQANKMQFTAWLFFTGGLLCGLGFVVQIATALPSATLPWYWLTAGSGLTSTSLALFFLSQIVHIRANTQK